MIHCSLKEMFLHIFSTVVQPKMAEIDDRTQVMMFLSHSELQDQMHTDLYLDYDAASQQYLCLLVVQH